MLHLTTKICEQNVSIIMHTIKDKSLKLLSFMERETRLSWPVRVERAYGFCFKNFILFAKDLRTPLTGRSNSRVARSSPLTKANKKDPSNDESSLWSGRRGSNSRHPPWQGGILPLNYPRGLYYYITCSFFEVKW